MLKNVPARTTQGMKFPGAPYGLKMACGENPKRVYGSKGNMPQTRMGNIALTRATWIKAQAYKRKWDKYYKDGGDMPERDLAMDTLKGVLDGKILVHNHCYRADEMANMIDMSKEFGYHIAAFHHAVEAYKIADLLRDNDICAAMWADWYGFKMEAYDAIKENIPLVHNAGACAIVHSDDPNGIQRLNQEAAKALADGRRAGHQRLRRGRLGLAQPQSGEGARHPRQDRNAGARQDGRRGAVEWQPLQRLHTPRAGVDRRRADVRRQRSQAAAGQRLRARPARRRRREVTARSPPGTGRGTAKLGGAAGSALRQAFACSASGEDIRRFRGNAMLFASPAAPRHSPSAAARSRSVTGLQPIPNGMVIVPRRTDRGGGRRADEAARRHAGDRRDWQMGDAGIVGGFSRLGLSEVDLSAEGSNDTTANGPFSAALDVVPSINPLASRSRSTAPMELRARLWCPMSARTSSPARAR